LAVIFGAPDKVSKTGDTMTGPLTVEAPITGTEAVTAGVVTLAWASTVTPDAALGGHFRCTLAGATTIDAPVSPQDGQKITFELIQDATGGRTVTWGTGFQFGTAGTPALSSAPAKRDLAGFVYSAAANSGAGAWLFTGAALGYLQAPGRG
jgi:hypothetical protein